MTLSPPQHAAAIISHYLKHLTEHAGLRWTEANDRDMATLADLLSQVEEPEELDSIPGFSLPAQARPAPAPPPPAAIRSDRVTEVFDREELTGNDAIPDPGFQRFRTQRYADEYPEVKRMLRR